MDKPIIGITTNIALAENTVMAGLMRTFVGDDYVQAVVRAGGIPLLLPPVDSEEVIRAQVRSVDGIILSGGSDVDPQLYGEEPEKDLGTVDYYRDAHEMAVVRAATRMKKPMMGICRGVQVINVAYGGTLYQDLGQFEGGRIKHFQSSARRDSVTHSVRIQSGSALADIIGAETVAVNSFHHQALKEVAPGFAVTAYSQDGVIEAVESQGDHFVLGIQWHPELLAAKHPAMHSLFAALTAVAGNGN